MEPPDDHFGKVTSSNIHIALHLYACCDDFSYGMSEGGICQGKEGPSPIFSF